MAESSQKSSPSKEPEPPTQQHSPRRASSDSDKPETPSKPTSPDQEPSDTDEFEGLSQPSSPELQPSIQNLQEREIPETPMQRRQTTSQVINMNCSEPNERLFNPSIPGPTNPSNPYRLVNAQLTEPDVKPFGKGPVVDPFGAHMARDNEGWLGRNRLTELAWRVSELEEEVARTRLQVGRVFAKLRHGRQVNPGRGKGELFEGEEGGDAV